MGQTVGGYRRTSRRESFSSCVSHFDNTSSSSAQDKKANTSTDEDDVTPQSLFPYTTSAKTPSNSDELSMSSSIIETSLIKEESHKGTHNVSGLASKIIPKRAWSGYHLFQLTNMRGERIHHNSPRVIRSPKIRPKLNTVDTTHINTGEEEIDQLITMMKNHKVSDDSPFDFNFSNKPLTPQHSPQPIPSSTFNSTSEFKFSFSANIPPSTTTTTKEALTATTTTTNEPNYIKVREIYREVDREEEEDDDEDEDEDEEEGQEGTESKPEQDQKRYDPQLNHRKILPLPKPRLKKSTNIPLPTTTINNNNNNTTTTTTIPDTTHLDNNNKKLKSVDINVLSDDQKPDNNKRKERNWKDNFTSHPIIPISLLPPPSSTELNKNEPKKPVKPEKSTTPSSSVLAAAVAAAAAEKKAAAAAAASAASAAAASAASAAAATAAAAAKKKKGKALQDASLLLNKQKKKTKTKTKQQKNKDDIAPGGFLSSDINLFQNPIPDDWICLFCQYDILFSGLTEARKKNGYYRRKKEISRRAREAELRRMGSLCYSDVDHDT